MTAGWQSHALLGAALAIECAAACAASHEPPADAGAAESAPDGGSPDAFVGFDTGPPFECVIGEAELSGRSPFGDAAELRFAWASVVDCGSWGDWSEITVVFSSDSERGVMRVGRVSATFRFEASPILGLESYSGDTIDAAIHWLEADGTFDTRPAVVHVLGADPAPNEELGWVHGEITVAEPDVSFEGRFRAAYCEWAVCI